MKEKISINCHSSIKITGDKIIYFDPYKITEEQNDADIIFITHDHYDHFELESIKKVMKEDTLIVIPNRCAGTVIDSGLPRSAIIGVNPNEQYHMKDIEINTINSYNLDKEFHPKKNNWVGYIIEINDEKILVAGDTDNTEELQKIKCDIALVPIGGTYTMTYQEAAELINKMKPKVVIPTHYGTVAGKVEDGEAFKKIIDSSIECRLLIK